MIKQSTIKKRLGVAIRKERERCGLSQEALGFEVGIHRNYVGSVERGERNVAIVNIVKIAKALNFTAAELLAKAEL